jgi:hypothetical protein
MGIGRWLPDQPHNCRVKRTMRGFSGRRPGHWSSAMVVVLIAVALAPLLATGRPAAAASQAPAMPYVNTSSLYHRLGPRTGGCSLLSKQAPGKKGRSGSPRSSSGTRRTTCTCSRLRPCQGCGTAVFTRQLGRVFRGGGLEHTVRVVARLKGGLREPPVGQADYSLWELRAGAFS